MSQHATNDDRITRLTVDQVHAMLDAGILEEGAPIELVDGVLVYKDRSDHGDGSMKIGKRHALAVKLLGRLDPELGRYGCHMQTQQPISLPPNDEPEPDGAVVRGEPRDYTDRLPSAEDVIAVIEVSDSSLAYDRSTKLAIYARAGIPQYLIVNVQHACIEVHEHPAPEHQRYENVTVFRAGSEFELRAGGRERLAVDPAHLLP